MKDAMQKKLLIVLPDLALGGGQLMNFRLADKLIMSCKWHVDIVALFSRSDSNYYEKKYPHVRVIRLSVDRLSQKFALPFRLARLMRSYDVAMAGLDLAATNYGFAAAKLSKTPFLAWVHVAFGEHMRTAQAYDRKLSLQIYRRIAHLVFPSQGARDSLREVIGGRTLPGNWHVIENFNDQRNLNTPSDQIIDSRIFQKPVILTIARLAPQKSLDRLIRAHHTLLKQGLKHHVVILGDGPERNFLETYAKSLKVDNTIFMPGHVSDVSQWLKKATIFTLCSRYEGLPLVLMEAMHMGTPIVSMDCPAGPREILDAGKAGMLTPKDDEDAYQLALGKLLCSPVLRESYSLKGRERSRRYSPERIIPVWASLLGELTNSTSGSVTVTRDTTNS